MFSKPDCLGRNDDRPDSCAAIVGLSAFDFRFTLGVAVEGASEFNRRTFAFLIFDVFVGVSDGARIDVFRRYNEGTVNNEQVVAMIEISELKQEGLQEKLQ